MANKKTSQTTKSQNKKAFCRSCKQGTNHTVLYEIQKRDSSEDEDMWFITDYFTLQCQGCETICLLEQCMSSENYDPETGEPYVITTIFPSPFEKKKTIEETYSVPKSVSKIYRECIAAFNEGLFLLTSIGMRMAVEAICKDKRLLDGKLEQRIDSLASLGFMTRQESELLHINRAMGNSSAHELREPSKDELEIGLDIIETTLRNAYILPEKAEILKTKYAKSDSKKPTLPG